MVNSAKEMPLCRRVFMCVCILVMDTCVTMCEGTCASGASRLMPGVLITVQFYLLRQGALLNLYFVFCIV